MTGRHGTPAARRSLRLYETPASVLSRVRRAAGLWAVLSAALLIVWLALWLALWLAGVA